MPVWLVENPAPVYVILGLVAVGLAFAWWTRQERKIAVALAVIIGLIALVKLLDYLVVTDHEKVVRAVQEMADNVRGKNVDRIFSLISDRFNGYGLDKPAFRKWVDARVHSTEVTDLKVWDFERTRDAPQPDKTSIYFLVKAQGPPEAERTFFRCKAFFVRDADGPWRLSGFELLPPHLDPEKAGRLHLPLH